MLSHQFFVRISAVFLISVSSLLCAQDPAPARYETMVEELLRDSIARETAHGMGQVPAYAKFLQTQFLAAGFDARDITLVPYEGTASLLVRYRGDGSSNRRPILFSSHMDVVPADPNDWVRNPFELQEDETFYFGRGVLDNKFDV